MNSRHVSLNVPDRLKPELERTIVASGWSVSSSQSGRVIAQVLCLEETEVSLQALRRLAAESAGDDGAKLIVVLGDDAATRAALHDWPKHWTWLPWPLSPALISLALKQVTASRGEPALPVGGARVGSDEAVDIVEQGTRQELLILALRACGLFDFEYDLATGRRCPATGDKERYGFSPSSIDSMLAFAHPDDRGSVQAAFERSRDTGKHFRLEIRAALHGRDYRWVRAKASVVGRSAEHPGRLLGVIWDVHDEREAKAQALASRLRLDQALTAAGMLSWEWTPERSGRRVIGNGLALPESENGYAELEPWLHADDRAMDQARFERALERRGEYFSKIRITAPNLGTRWLQLTGHPTLSPSGELIALSGVALDVSSLQRVDEELADARALLLDSLDAGRMYCWEWNLIDGTRRTIGPARSVLGCAPAEAQAVQTLIHPDDLEKDEDLLARAILEGKAYQNEFRILRADGEVRWIYSRGNPIKNADGQLIRLSGVAIDVTERRNAEEGLAQANHRLEIALEAARLNPWSVDLLSGLHLGGPRDIELFGDNIISDAQFTEFVVPEDRQLVARLTDPDFLASGESIHLEFRVQHRDGSRRWLACHAKTQLDMRCVPVQLIGVSYDITESRQAQDKLARSLTRLERVQSASKVVLWEWNRIEGARCLQAGGREFSDVDLPRIHPADLRRVLRQVVGCLRHERPFDEEFRVSLDGEEFNWVAVQGARSAFDAEKGVTLSGVMIDVSARRRVAEQLSLAQERLQRALDAAKMVCWDWSVDAVHGVRSQYTARVTSGSGSATGSEIDPRDQVRHQTAIEDALTGRTPDYRCEFRVRRADGSLIWLLSIGSRLHDENGRICGLTGVAIDISAQKAMEGELEQSREWQRMAVEAGELNLWRTDATTGERVGGDLDERLFGFVPTRSEQIEQLIHPDDRARVDVAWRKSIDSGVPYRLDYRIVVGASTRWLRVRGKRLFDPNTGMPQMVGATLDITEQKYAEVELRTALRLAREASEAKSSFLASISHELRTPLNAVIGFSRLLEGTSIDDTQKTHLRALQSGAGQLYALINDVLDFSRIEAGEMTLERTPFLLLECLEPALDMVASVADEKGLCLQMTCRGQFGRRVLGDPTRLRQIAVNLLGNATKFTEQGGVEFELESSEQGDEMVLVMRVRDSGIGMNAEVMAALFQPFRQGDVSMTRRFGGTGLGLSICKHLVDMMEGDIRVRSNPDMGSCFEVQIKLPYAEAKVEEPRPLLSQGVGILVTSSLLQEGLSRLIEEFGAAPRVLDRASAVQQIAQSGTSLQALIVGRPMLDVLAELKPWPLRSDGVPIPVVVLVGINQALQPWRGDYGERYIPLVRTIKPRPLLQALQAAMDVEPPATDAMALQVGALAKANAPSELAQLHVLVAEDIEINRLLLSYQLESLGVAAVMVNDGQEVLDRLAAESFDTILMDVEMPGMDGLEAASRIRTDPMFQDRFPYIIAVTAHVIGDSRTRFLSSGMDDFVSKPVMVDDLRAALQRSLATKALR